MSLVKDGAASMFEKLVRGFAMACTTHCVGTVCVFWQAVALVHWMVHCHAVWPTMLISALLVCVGCVLAGGSPRGRSA
jgi:hypothetical protein